MDETSQGPSRRGFLARGAALVAGALGLGAARASAAPPLAAPTSRLTLYARHFHLHAQNRRPGVVPAKGDRLSAYGELLDGPQGRTVGEFSSALFALASPFGALPAGATSLELHSFNLHDGTILGFGTATAGAESVYAIVGGTGRYAGARGTYVARQRPREQGGDGTAVFELTLVA